MKNIFIISALLFSMPFFAQSISVKESSEKFSTGSQNAVTTTILENNLNEVLNEWKKVLKDFKNEKVKDNNNEVFGDNIIIKDWGNNPVDIYTKFEENKGNKTVKMMVAVDLGGTYLTQSGDKEKYNFIEKLVKDFAVKQTKAPLEEAVKDAEKLLVKMEDQQKDLERDKNDLKSDIEKYKDKINDAEKNIKKNEEEQTKKKAEIDAQKKVVETVTGKLKAVN